MADKALILGKLLEEISVITGLPCERLCADWPLSRNGINSLCFIELVLAIKREWGLDFLSGGLSSEDTASVAALSERIARELP